MSISQIIIFKDIFYEFELKSITESNPKRDNKIQSNLPYSPK